MSGSKRASPPRLNQELTEEQYNALNEFIPWGLRRPLFSAIIDSLIEILKDPENRKLVISGIIARSISVTDFVKLDVGETKEKHLRDERPRTHGDSKPKPSTKTRTSSKKQAGKGKKEEG